MALLGPFVRVPGNLADYRVHGGSITYRPSASERADEPVQVGRAFFARHDLPDRIRRYGRRGLANAYLLSGFIHGRSNRPGRAMLRFLQALASDPRPVLSRKAAGFFLACLTTNLKRFVR
jgi:hypothetical protein